MFELLASPDVWISLFTLAILEVVLGIDNIVFLSVLSSRLPEHQQRKARIYGLLAAMSTRLLLLAGVTWLATLSDPLFSLFDHAVSARDLVLLAGGLFLLYKATTEIHGTIEPDDAHGVSRATKASLAGVIVQIGLIDIVFSLDSVMTAVGMAEHLEVMMAAVVIAILVMMFAAEPVSAFVQRHLSVKLLALSFLMMIGFVLVAEGTGFHVPKGYIYAALTFSLIVEGFKLAAQKKRDTAA